MVVINYNSREVSCKIVYYGPGLSGKTTNLQHVHGKVPGKTKGDLISLATDADRTLYFDFLPINIGDINGFTTKFQLYTVPGQVFYNATRKLVLRGTDGIVFVADSQSAKADENVESLDNLRENLAEYGLDLNSLPIVMQYNKRDLPAVMSVDELNELLNKQSWPVFEACASEGKGVFDTLKYVIKIVLDNAQKSSETMLQPEEQSVEDAQVPPEETIPSSQVIRPEAEPQEPAEVVPNVQSEVAVSSQTDTTASPVSEPAGVSSSESDGRYNDARVNLAASADSAANPVNVPLVGGSSSSETTCDTVCGSSQATNTHADRVEAAATVARESRSVDSGQRTDRIKVVKEDDIDKELGSDQAVRVSVPGQPSGGLDAIRGDSDGKFYEKTPGTIGQRDGISSEPCCESLEAETFAIPTMQESLRRKRGNRKRSNRKKRFFLFRWLSRRG
jgi:signal recognition particle receptor subunit beta